MERRLLSQWFLKITDYADDLLHEIELERWPDRKIMQKLDWEVRRCARTI